jgi:uncharacterized delta-60 repeat protein
MMQRWRTIPLVFLVCLTLLTASCGLDAGSLVVLVAWPKGETPPADVASLVFMIEGKGINQTRRSFEPSKKTIDVPDLATGEKRVTLQGVGAKGDILYQGSSSVTIRDHEHAAITVNLAPLRFILSITKSGDGTVTSQPSGIDCGSTCSASYDSGTSVTLTATPMVGLVFSGWSDAGCSGTGTCTVIMDAAKSVTATFSQMPAPLIDLAPTYHTFSATQGGANPASQQVLITNAGSETLSGLTIGTITYGAGANGWLQPLTLSATSAPATLTVQPVTGSLVPGTYTAIIPIFSAGASNSPRNVTVSLTVTSGAAFHDDFTAIGTKLDLTKWTTEFGYPSFLGRTQLADWVTPGGVGQFISGTNGAELALNTYNPTNDPSYPPSLYGTHGKTIAAFQPTGTSTVVLTITMQLAESAVRQRGLVFGLYFFGCPGNCSTHHDQIDIELVTNRLQGGPLQVQLNRYANEPLGAGHGGFVNLPPGFDPLAMHEWTIRWSLSTIEYRVDGVLLAAETNFVPQGPMHVNMIAWGPGSDWTNAYDASLQTETNSAQNHRLSAYVRLVEVTIVPSLQVPPVPTGIAAMPGDKQMTIRWDSVSGATSYNLYMALSTGVLKSNYDDFQGGIQQTNITSPHVHTGLTNGAAYFFVVTALNSSGESLESSQVSGTPALVQPSGSLDTTFGTGGKVMTDFGGEGDDRAASIAIQSDKKIVIGGVAYNGSNSDFALARYNIDGSLDPTFDTDGLVITDFLGRGDGASSIAIQSDGKIITAGSADNGSNSDFALTRHNVDGSLDTTFDTDGKVVTDFIGRYDTASSIAIQSDGKIIVAGGSVDNSHLDSDFMVMRYNSDGSLDTTFGTDGKVLTDFESVGSFGSNDYVNGIAIQSDKKIVLVGGAGIGSTSGTFALARYNPDGSLDTTFNTDGKVRTNIGKSVEEGESIAIQSDGKILVAGWGQDGSGQDLMLVRYRTDGSLDPTFDTDGKIITDSGEGSDYGYSVAIQPNGKIVVAGYTYDKSSFLLVRYNLDGSLDTDFDIDGKVITSIGSIGNGYSVAIQPDGKIVVAGKAHNGSNYDFAIVRYNP